jgi:hypothetical protein
MGAAQEPPIIQLEMLGRARAAIGDRLGDRFGFVAEIRASITGNGEGREARYCGNLLARWDRGGPAI